MTAYLIEILVLQVFTYSLKVNLWFLLINTFLLYIRCISLTMTNSFTYQNAKELSEVLET